LGAINLPPNLYSMFTDIQNRLTKLENSGRFTLPNVATDPTAPRNGDLWLNTTSNSAKYVDNVGAVTTLASGATGKVVIQTLTLSATSLISFSSIPATYRDLELHIIGGGSTLSSTTLSMTLNGSTAGVYSYMNQWIQLATGTSATAPTASNGAFQTSIQLTPFSFNPGGQGHLFSSIYDYKGSSRKTGTIYAAGALPAATKPIGFGVFAFDLTAAITDISISVAGSGGINGSAVLVGVY
jgi:hypothetical protein